MTVMIFTAFGEYSPGVFGYFMIPFEKKDLYPDCLKVLSPYFSKAYTTPLILFDNEVAEILPEINRHFPAVFLEVDQQYMKHIYINPLDKGLLLAIGNTGTTR